MKDHNGYLDIQSTPGSGTTLRLYFPVTQARPVSSKAIVSLDNYYGQGELVLVVDDQADQRLIAKDMLTEFGYRVHTVPSGESAISYLHKNRPDIIILDMIMDPGMDGLEAFLKIKERHPAQRVVIASGYSENDRLHEALRQGVKDYISKPYSMIDLARSVYETLHLRSKTARNEN